MVLLSTSYTYSQSTATPFDLIPRIQQEADSDSVTISISSNPFDIVKIRPMNKPAATGPGFRIERPDKPLSAKEKENVYRRFIFITILVMAIVMTLVVTLFRILIAKIWKAFLNDNLLNQLQREQSSGVTTAYLILYALFFINAGIFTFLACNYYDVQISRTNAGSLFLLIGGIAAFFLLKHAMLGAIEFIFPVKKEVSTYQFTIMIFNIVIGFFLAIMVLFLAYAPEDVVKYSFFGSIGLLVLVYLFRNLRGMFIANRFLAWHKFHFLLYLCAVEIAPILVILKLIISRGSV